MSPIILTFMLLIVCASCLTIDLDQISDDEMIEYINSLGTTWKAGKNFHGFPNFYAKNLLDVEIMNRQKTRTVIHENNDLPDTFDARKAWPECPSIGLIHDQGSCKSGWAFAPVSAMSDRLCIASKGSITVDLSAEDVIDCCDICGSKYTGKGCHGGYMVEAWVYYNQSGIVTGGLYQGSGCKPYSIPPCEHFTSGSRPACGLQDTPQCKKQCVPGYEKSYMDDKFYGQIPYSFENVQDNMKDIMINGPVVSEFNTYQDFLFYKSGIYDNVTIEVIGVHSVKILGWGIEDGTDYWLAANSWNTDWGDNGYFKIKRGNNSCGIEESVVASLPLF